MPIAPWLQAFDPIRAASAGGSLGVAGGRNDLEARGQDIGASEAAGRLGLAYAQLGAEEQRSERQYRMEMAKHAADQLITLHQMATTQANVESEIQHRHAMEQHSAFTEAATAAAELEKARHNRALETKGTTPKQSPELTQFDRSDYSDVQKQLDAYNKQLQPAIDAYEKSPSEETRKNLLTIRQRMSDLQQVQAAMRIKAQTPLGAAAPTAGPSTVSPATPSLSPPSSGPTVVSIRRKKSKPLEEKPHDEE